MTLEWPGRRWRKGDAAADGEGTRAPTKLIEESLLAPARGRDHRLVMGDARTVARSLVGEGLEQKVDLVYIDPPYASQADYVHEARLDGPADGRVVRSLAYEDTWSKSGMGAYLDSLAPAVELLTRLLAPSGTIWIHLDWRAAYLVRVLLDEMLGRDAFINEIVWRRAPNLGRQAASHQFGRTLDTLLVYGAPEGDKTSPSTSRTKLVPPTRLEPIEEAAIRWDDEGRPFTTAPRGDYTDASIARLDLEGRVHRTSSGRVYIKYFLVKNAEGVWCRERRVDALWTDVPPLRHAAPGERTGFPTQKPRALLDRIIACATPPGGLVVDLFCGSGTTGEAAFALGRRFVLGDAGPLAIATARARLLRAGVPLSIEACDAYAMPAGESPRVDVRPLARKKGSTVVELIAPTEPAAWAIDTAYDASRSFRVAWHSERKPGARPTPAAREAVVESLDFADIAVRVYGDDGTVGMRVVTAAERARAVKVGAHP